MFEETLFYAGLAGTRKFNKFSGDQHAQFS